MWWRDPVQSAFLELVGGLGYDKIIRERHQKLKVIAMASRCNMTMRSAANSAHHLMACARLVYPTPCTVWTVPLRAFGELFAKPVDTDLHGIDRTSPKARKDDPSTRRFGTTRPGRRMRISSNDSSRAENICGSPAMNACCAAVARHVAASGSLPENRLGAAATPESGQSIPRNANGLTRIVVCSAPKARDLFIHGAARGQHQHGRGIAALAQI